MKKLLSWAKANPLVLAAIVLTVIFLGGLTYAYLGRQSHLEDLNKRVTAVITPIEKLKNTPIELPPQTAGAPPVTIRGVVTPGVIKHRQDINAIFASQKANVFDQVQAINNARQKLSRAFQTDQEVGLGQTLSELRAQVIEMFGPAGNGTADQPRLGAGMPPATTDLEIARELNFAAATFDRTHRLPPTPLNPTGPQALRHQEQLLRYNEERSKVLGDKLLQALQNRAKSIHLYAVPRPDWTPTGVATFNPLDRLDFPVDLTVMDPRRFGGAPPPLSEVWEAQMQVLAIQNVLTAIARVNQSSDPQSNVLTAPVKQLLKLKVYPGYVTDQASASVGGGAPAGVAPVSVGPVGMGGMGGAAGAMPVTVINSEEHAGLTKRKSSRDSLYDVKHISLSVVVDYQRLPQLFQALAEVNFMTVLKMQVTDVDEYEALHKGFVYGAQDCVRVDLLIESIWFRNWTAPLKKNEGGMPKEIREGLGITLASQ